MGYVYLINVIEGFVKLPESIISLYNSREGLSG